MIDFNFLLMINFIILNCRFKFFSKFVDFLVRRGELSFMEFRYKIMVDCLVEFSLGLIRNIVFNSEYY